MKYIIIGGVIAVLGITAAVYFFPSEEKRVKKQFHLLSVWVSKERGENLLIMAQKTRNIGTLFGETCGFKTYLDSLSGSYTPEEISAYAARGRMQFSEFNLKFYDIAVVFPEMGIARVSLTVRVKGNLTSGERVDETHELECTLKKTERKWLFNHIEMIEVLKR